MFPSTSVLWAALGGGALIGASASILLLVNGRIAGVSGIVAGLFSRERDEVPWRAFFVGGLLAGGLLFAVIAPGALSVPSTSSVATAAIAGLLVGVGTRLSGGCTSGHG